ncbi:MAG TPA: hypothetical protein VE861_04290, partial [Gemmatimonadaceae bacterium]|nr:hypothetical protein [Gemmatimonadaceae bacterium]
IRKRALDAPLREVVTVADGNDPFSGCLLGLTKCTDHAACPIHERWIPLRTRLCVLLETQTIADLATKGRNGRSRLAPLRKALRLRR